MRMNISKRQVQRKMNRTIKALLGALPAVTMMMRSRRRTPVAAYVLGGIGIAIVSGVAAVMFLSPRTRSRALNAAKDAYAKVNETVIHKRAELADAANGLVESQRMQEPSPGL